MKRTPLFVAALVVAGLARPAIGEHPRYVIGIDSIAAAVNTMGIHVVSDQVTLLADVVSTTSAPRLRVRAIEKSPDHALMVRLECENSEQCLPFYARIRGNDVFGAPAALPFPRVDETVRPKTPDIRKGATATLLLDGQHVHVRVAVVCLENGVVGQKIRVSTGDHRPAFLAEVVDGNSLKGTLQ